MKNIFVPFLVFVFLFAMVDDASAQRRGKKKRVKKEDTEEKTTTRDRDEDEDEFEGSSLSDKLNIEIKTGNLNFFGNQLSLSLRSNVGYKFNNTFSAGAGGKLFYDYVNFVGSNSDLSVFSYGGLIYGRAKITQTFYAQAEYSIVNFGEVNLTPQATLGYPKAGIGYVQQGYNWSYGLEVLAILSDPVRDRLGLVEYWINFSKNF